jgi:hypothetical protein
VEYAHLKTSTKPVEPVETQCWLSLSKPKPVEHPARNPTTRVEQRRLRRVSKPKPVEPVETQCSHNAGSENRSTPIHRFEQPPAQAGKLFADCVD